MVYNIVISIPLDVHPDIQGAAPKAHVLYELFHARWIREQLM